MYSKEQLYNLLNETFHDPKHVISGQQISLNNNPDMVDAMLAKIKEITGKVPSIIGIDVTELYAKNLASADTMKRVAEQTIKHAQNGGIVTVSCHMINPLHNAKDGVWYRGWLGKEDKWKEILTDGTYLNADFKRLNLDPIAKFMKELADAGVPVLFRPLHELNGGWFWWCNKQAMPEGVYKLDPECQKKMYIYIRRYMEEKYGLDNLLWCFTPNISFGGWESVTECYPGDEYVDILGMDWYTNENDSADSNNSYPDLLAKGKITALAEFGPNPSVKDTFECDFAAKTIEKMEQDGMPVSYFLFWHSSLSFAILKNSRELLNMPCVLNTDDTAKWFENH